MRRSKDVITTRTMLFRSAEYEGVKAFLECDKSEQLLRYYSEHHRPCYEEQNFFDNEDIMGYAGEVFIITCFTRSMPFARKDATSGLTYDKKTKKCTIWYSRLKKDRRANRGWLNLLDVQRFLNHLDKDKYEWYINFTHKVSVAVNEMFLTGACIGNIISGKYSSESDLIKHFIRFNLKQSYKAVDFRKAKAFLFNDADHRRRNYRHDSLMYFSRLAKNVNDFFDWVEHIDNDTTLLQDMTSQACALGRTIDFKWSERKLNDVHQAWSIEIMKFKEKYLTQKQYYADYVLEDLYKLLPAVNIKIITNALDLYREGYTQKHCVYTNYNYNVEAKTYFVFHDEVCGATIGVHRKYDLWCCDQIRVRYNADIDFGRKTEIQNFFINNKQVQTLLNLLKVTARPKDIVIEPKKTALQPISIKDEPEDDLPF